MRPGQRSSRRFPTPIRGTFERTALQQGLTGSLSQSGLRLDMHLRAERLVDQCAVTRSAVPVPCARSETIASLLQRSASDLSPLLGNNGRDRAQQGQLVANY